jgi:DNA-binding transcriptional regulator YhcF (GntR family)
MTNDAPSIVASRRAWPAFSLREKRTRLVEERLAAVVAEARLLGIASDELARTLRRMYREEQS